MFVTSFGGERVDYGEYEHTNDITSGRLSIWASGFKRNFRESGIRDRLPTRFISEQMKNRALKAQAVSSDCEAAEISGRC